MIFDNRRSLRTINEAPNPIIIKIFFYIAFHQPEDGIRGFQISKKQLQYDLKLGRTVFFDALHWLKDNLCIQEIKQVETSDFMANPYIVMNNSDRDARIAEWSRRCKLDFEREQRLKKQRRLRELKKAAQQ